MAPASVLLWLSISRGLAKAHTSLRWPWRKDIYDEDGAGDYDGDDDDDGDGDVDEDDDDDDEQMWTQSKMKYLYELHVPAAPNDIV